VAVTPLVPCWDANFFGNVELLKSFIT
jgi:hypothetical protein